MDDFCDDKDDATMKPQEKTVRSIDADIEWICFEDKKSGIWVGVCKPLGLTAEGDDYNDLLKSIAECVDLLFQDLVETGDIAEFLAERNWKLNRKLPAKSNRRDVVINIPATIKPVHKMNTTHIGLEKAFC